MLQIVMLLPTQLPVDGGNMNYTCVTVGAVMILVMGAWYLPFWGAKHWVSRSPFRRRQPPCLTRSHLDARHLRNGANFTARKQRVAAVQKQSLLRNHGAQICHACELPC